MFRKAGIILLLVGAITAVQLRGDDEPLTRQKRQIPESTFPTFGPDVERTADGVPILDESYLERRDRPAARFFSQFDQPQTDTEGLRLYDSLLGGSSGGRPELRSLDTESPFAGQFNGFDQSSQSNSYTKKVSSRRTSRKSIQVKSAGSTASTTAADLPSGFGPSTGPQFSEEVNYQRTTNANKRRNAQLRSLDTSSGNGNSCVQCRRRIGSGEGATGTELKTLTRSNTVNAQGHQTEGLRLYRKLLRNGASGSSRNQLRALNNDDDLPQNGILPHHRQSAAWSEKEESHSSSSQSHSRTSSSSSAGEQIAHAVPQEEEEVNYRRSNAGRRSHTRNASRTRNLSSSSSSQNNGASNCVTCQTTNSQIQTRSASNANLLEESPVTYHRSSRVPSTGNYLIPPAPTSSGSSSWAEREERSHHSSRTVSRTINGVETNGLGEPLHSEEQATYRRVASGGSGDNNNGNGAAATTRSNLRSGARTLSTSESEQSSAAASHSSSSSSSNGHRAAARTLSVAGLSNTNGNGRSRRYNCSRISTTSLSEGAQSVTELVTPPPCVIRRSSSSSDNQLNTRASTRSLDLPYPPVQTLGRGDLEVHARVLESDHENDSAFSQHSQQQQHHSEENHEESSANGYVAPTQVSYRNGRKHKKAFYRRTVFKNYTTSEYPASVETWLGA